MESPIFEEKELELSNNYSTRMCSCGLRAPIWTSWSDENPSRRFIGCSNYMNRAKYCHFFSWIDPAISERQKKIIIAGRLRSEIMELQHKLEKKEIEVQQLVDDNDKVKKKYAKLKDFVSKMEDGKSSRKQRQMWFFLAIVMVWIVIVAIVVQNVSVNGQITTMLMP